jgi:hypothetical protein
MITPYSVIRLILSILDLIHCLSGVSLARVVEHEQLYVRVAHLFHLLTELVSLLLGLEWTKEIVAFRLCMPASGHELIFHNYLFSTKQEIPAARMIVPMNHARTSARSEYISILLSCST